MKAESVKGDSIEILLRQLGATKIQKVSGYLYFIKFTLDNDFEVLYTYNINAKNKYFLQRIQPYPLPQGAFGDENKLVAFIKEDLKKFKFFKKRKYFDIFLETASKSHKFLRNLDDVYLSHNIENEQNTAEILKEINQTLDEITNKLDCIEKYSE